MSAHGGVPEQGDQVDDEELLELVEMEVRELLSTSTTSRAMTFRLLRGSALKRWKVTTRALGKESIVALDGAGQLHSAA